MGGGFTKPKGAGRGGDCIKLRTEERALVLIFKAPPLILLVQFKISITRYLVLEHSSSKERVEYRQRFVYSFISDYWRSPFHKKGCAGVANLSIRYKHLKLLEGCSFTQGS
jgi:hypothetical protein